MIPAHGRQRQLVGLGAAYLAVVMTFPTPVQAQAPRVGEARNVTVITLSMQVGSTEKETRQVTYTPPPGWYVRSHTVHCVTRQGNSSFSVNTVPRNWDCLSEEKVQESYRMLINLAGKSHAAEMEAKLNFEREELLKGLQCVRASHHALVVNATARGEGFLRGGGCIELTVTAELVYIGTEETLRQTTARRRARFEK